MTAHLFDRRRLLCRTPVIRVQDRVQSLGPGTLIEAICTNSGAMHDIPAWCRINGHSVVATGTRDGEYRIVLRVGPVQGSSA